MKEEIITFETAKLAKKKGFTWDVKEAYYASKDELSKIMREECWNGYPVNTEDEAYLAAPTQSLLQKWLREVHNIVVQVTYDIILSTSCDIGCNLGIIKIDNKLGRSHTLMPFRMRNTEYLNYEEALEKGLIEALKLIKV